MARKNKATTAKTVSAVDAPKPVMKPDLTPLLRDFCTTIMAIGPNGMEAQSPTQNALIMFNSIFSAKKFTNIRRSREQCKLVCNCRGAAEAQQYGNSIGATVFLPQANIAEAESRANEFIQIAMGAESTGKCKLIYRKRYAIFAE